MKKRAEGRGKILQNIFDPQKSVEKTFFCLFGRWILAEHVFKSNYYDNAISKPLLGFYFGWVAILQTRKHEVVLPTDQHILAPTVYRTQMAHRVMMFEFIREQHQSIQKFL